MLYVFFSSCRCTGSLTGFADNLLKVTPEVVRESVDWLDEGHVTSSSVAMTNNLVEAVTRAIACEGVSNALRLVLIVANMCSCFVSLLI